MKRLHATESVRGKLFDAIQHDTWQRILNRGVIGININYFWKHFDVVYNLGEHLSQVNSCFQSDGLLKTSGM